MGPSCWTFCFQKHGSQHCFRFSLPSSRFVSQTRRHFGEGWFWKRWLHFCCSLINTNSRHLNRAVTPKPKSHETLQTKYGWITSEASTRQRAALDSSLLRCHSAFSFLSAWTWIPWLHPPPPPPPPLEGGRLTWLCPWPRALPGCFVWNGWRSDVFGHHIASH